MQLSTARIKPEPSDEEQAAYIDLCSDSENGEGPDSENGYESEYKTERLKIRTHIQVRDDRLISPSERVDKSQTDIYVKSEAQNVQDAELSSAEQRNPPEETETESESETRNVDTSRAAKGKAREDIRELYEQVGPSGQARRRRKIVSPGTSAEPVSCLALRKRPPCIY